MSGSTNQDLDKNFLLIITDFENTLRLDDTTMDEAEVDKKILDHAEIQKKFLEQKTKEIVDQMEISLDQKLNDFLNNLRGQGNTPGQQHQDTTRGHSVPCSSQEEVETSYIGIVDLDPGVHMRRTRNDLEVIKGEALLGRNEKPTQGIFDTGAKRSVISEKIAREYGIKSSNIKIKAVVADKETFSTYLTERTRQMLLQSTLGNVNFGLNHRCIRTEFDFSEDEMEVMLTDQLDESEDIESDLDGWDFRPNEKVKFENFELLNNEENIEALELLESNKELFATSLEDLKEPIFSRFKQEAVQENRKEEEKFSLQGDKLLYRENFEDFNWKIVPKISDRAGLIKETHLLAHFGEEKTYKDLQNKYSWKGMHQDTQFIISNCMVCIRHQKVPVWDHPAKSLPINDVMDRVQID
ncbi:hypothetical protein BpHYR1_049994 [Brachionus plicatilis]|uniref:Integrase zinc-binding domain-containing protein n=1 Tax=Brachionus plicatilis TaxID=10195 RepID=A0A3M7S9B7_BRAPC|nr:hypothetical protein BpHYR1_049994 [Brachionus plicatilis]